MQLGPLELPPPPPSWLTGISGCSLTMGEAVAMAVKASIAIEGCESEDASEQCCKVVLSEELLARDAGAVRGYLYLFSKPSVARLSGPCPC